MKVPSRRWWLPPAILATLVALYALAGFFGVPKLVRSVAQGQVAKLGRKLALGDVRFNPFTFEARVTGLALTEGDGSPLAAFQELYVDADAAQSLWTRGVVLQAVHLTAPDVAMVVNADGSINLAKLVPPSPEPQTPKAPGPPPSIVIGDLAIERGRVGIEDRSRPQPFRLALSPIEFRIKDFRTELKHRNDYTFKGTATTGEELEWTGDFTVQPLGSTGRFALHKLQSSTIAAYLQDQLPVRLVSGVADLGGDYRLTLDPSLSLDVHLPAITVRNLAVAEPGKDKTAATPVSIAEVEFHEAKVSLARREVTLERIGIQGLHADVVREPDGSLNLARLYAPPAPSPKPATPAAVNADAAPWHVAVGRIDLADAAIQAEDRTVDPIVRTRIGDVKATLSGLTGDPAAPLHLDASLGIDKTGRLGAQGTIHLQPLSAHMDLDLQDVDLSALQPYLSPHTGLGLQSALLAVKGTLSYAQPQDTGPRIDFAGEAGVSKLDLDDRASRQDLLSWQRLKLAGIDFHSAPQQLNIQRIDLSEPFVRVEIAANRQINIANALKVPGAPVTAPPAATVDGKASAATPAKPMPVRIATLHIDKGKMNFTDRSIDPNFSAAIFALAGDITRLSSDPAARAKIHLEGKVDQFAPVVIGGEIAPAAYDRDTDITMSFRNMDLVRFNPYSGRFAGYNIVKGKLTTELHYRIHDRQLQADHHVVLDQLEFGDATGSKDAVPLPLKLAVALLKDRHGVIDLGLPVMGSLDDPSFRIGPLIWKVVMNSLTKVVTSPFTALASLIGGGSDEMAYVDFAPGAAGLTDAETRKLAKLAQALVERPQLKLDVPLALATTEDTAALARRELDRQVPPDPPDTAPEAARKNRLRALEDLHRKLLGQAPDYPKDDAAKGEARDTARIAWLESVLLPKLAPDAEALQHLASERARTVESAILANPGIQAERIFLTARPSSSVDASGAVRMELSLQ